MFSSINCLLTCVTLLLYSSKTCTGDIPPGPSLVLYMPTEPEYTDVLVRRVGDNMTLVCELRGDTTSRVYVWNYIPENGTTGQSPYKVSASMSTSGSTLSKQSLSASDSGQYMCSAPPFSVTKYILVQPPGPKFCGPSAFWCGERCMAAQYVCDGYRDCTHGEDEARHMCEQDVCARSDKLNCSTGRCISEAACCRAGAALCQQPSCCDEYPRYSTLEGFIEQEYPPLYDDRHAPDDYGFIQSTIYTVTACALIFMIAVVLLVSAICKMHMKRAALRSYAHAERATRRHYTMQYAQTHRFPPCYEASRLLEQERTRDSPEPPDSPARPHITAQTVPEPEVPGEVAPPPERGGLARLSAIFSSRYRQVPTQSDVELTNVRSSSLNNSPTRNRTLDNYRSPTYCDLNTSEFYFTDPDTGNLGRDLNFMATPIDFRPSPLDRVIDLDRQRLTLHLGRFQLTIPRFGRRADGDRRPDTPNVAEININDLDFVRMTSNDTYTLNGRTIRLLGANFENYPVLPDGTRPPPYNEAMRCKFFGPPPEYLSREVLNSRADEEARTNIEMPPCYDELGNHIARNNGDLTVESNGITVNRNNGDLTVESNGITVNAVAANNGDSTVTDTDARNGITNNRVATINSDSTVESNGITSDIVTANNGDSTVSNDNTRNGLTYNGNPVITVTNTDINLNNNSMNAIIDNLPAIDSDVNANDTLLV